MASKDGGKMVGEIFANINKSKISDAQKIIALNGMFRALFKDTTVTYKGSTKPKPIKKAYGGMVKKPTKKK